MAILNALPRHIGYIIIEHDLDVALRVSEYVSMMHNGRVFKEGTPAEIEADPEVQDAIIERFLLRDQIKDYGLTASGSIALTLLQSVPRLF